MTETHRGMRIKIVVLVVLISSVWLPSSAAEVSKILALVR